MANTNAPFGFRCIGSLAGNDFRVSPRKILSTDTNAIYKGDAVTTSAGYITSMTPGTGTVSGVAVGFAWLSKSLGYYAPFKNWPGNGDALGDVDVLVIDDPNAIFQVQCGATALGLADIGNNVQFVKGTGNTANGLSGSYLNTASATTNTLPFKIMQIPGVPTGDVFTDSTSPYNVIEVTFNNESYKQLTGGA